MLEVTQLQQRNHELLESVKLLESRVRAPCMISCRRIRTQCSAASTGAGRWGMQVASEAGQTAMLGKDVEQLQWRNRELVEAVSLAESRVRQPAGRMHACQPLCRDGRSLGLFRRELRDVGVGMGAACSMSHAMLRPHASSHPPAWCVDPVVVQA